MEKTKLVDLKPNQKRVYINNITVVETSEITEKEVNGEKIKICMGKIIDDSINEPIDITAWGFASQFLYGAKLINLENVYCKEYEGKLSISTGKYGRIRRIDEKTN